MSRKIACGLLVHEWAAVSVFLSLIGMIGINAYLSSLSLVPGAGDSVFLTSQQVAVHVQGDVENPGTIYVSRESTLANVLEKAKPFPNANLKRVNLSANPRHNQVLKIKTTRAKKTPKEKEGHEMQALIE